MSSPATTRSAAASPFILSPGLDALLFFGTPALILPAVALAQRSLPPEQIYLLVASFGALGHHLPGMMRAYGDRALFRRFRTRFIVAPIFLVAACALLTFTSPSALVLLTYGWGVWHGLMQTHGFSRIYDGRRGPTDALTARLDHLLVLTWFAAAVVFSPTRIHYVLDRFYDVGGPVVSLSFLAPLRAGVGMATAAVTLAFVAQALRRWRAGRPPAALKLVTLASSIGFFWYCNVAVDNLLIGVVLFELAHDVQYLAIVWLFNRRRVEADPEVGSFTRFLFRQRAVFVALYVALILAYGSLQLVASFAPVVLMGKIMTGVLSASTLLHFYYDGFIWKMREKSTSATLGLAHSGSAQPTRPAFPTWATHGMKWALFVVPAALLLVAWSDGKAEPAARMASLAQLSPGFGVAQYNLALARWQQGDLEGAVAAGRAAVAAESTDDEALHRNRVQLAWSLVDLAEARLREGRVEEARASLEEVRAMNPGFASVLNDEAKRVHAAGDAATAEAHLRCALVLEPDHGLVHLNLALLLEQAGRLDEAREHAQRAVALMPTQPVALQALARLGVVR
jgi:hypothetical protein